MKADVAAAARDMAAKFWAVPGLRAELQALAADIEAINEVPAAPLRRNCYSCKHAVKQEHWCALFVVSNPDTPAEDWKRRQRSGITQPVPETADGCPGYTGLH